MEGFTNLQLNFMMPNGPSQPELEVILATLRWMMQRLDGAPQQGTFILMGQQEGEEMQQLIRTDFAEGELLYRYDFGYDDGECGSGWGERLSSQTAQEAIAAIDRQSYQNMTSSRYFGKVQSGIYYRPMYNGTLKVLVLNTTYGRFLASVNAGKVNNFTPGVDVNLEIWRVEHDLGIWRKMLLSVAVAIDGLARGNDIFLRKSTEALHRSMNDDERDVVMQLVRDFLTMSWPELQNWQAWRKQEREKGLPMFFEY